MQNKKKLGQWKIRARGFDRLNRTDLDMDGIENELDCQRIEERWPKRTFQPLHSFLLLGAIHPWHAVSWAAAGHDMGVGGPMQCAVLQGDSLKQVDYSAVQIRGFSSRNL